jgi:YD repeat-containing protein
LVQQYAYDAKDRLERLGVMKLEGANWVEYAHTRWEYPLSDVQRLTYATVQDNATEVMSEQILDGAGRALKARSPLPNSAGGWRGQVFVYDNVGRLTQAANPLEVDANYNAAGDDAGKSWIGPQQTYDYQGRVTATTNVDGTQRTAIYSACGCAGGDTAVIKDEGGRRRKYYNDALGRLIKVEELNWDQSVYATTNYAYNLRDQIETITQGSGAAARTRTFSYDGHGRLQSRTTPEQGTMSYAYNTDDTVNFITDARGVKTTFGYDPRHLVTSLTYDRTNAPGVADTKNVTFGYDAPGNRTNMTEWGQGTVNYAYDFLSRPTSEARGIDGVGTYTFNYAYNAAGQLQTVTNPFGSVVNYNYDATGQATSVAGSGAQSAANYVSSIGYRAFGGVKNISYGNTRQLSLQYNNRLFLTQWNLPNPSGANTSSTALGYSYDYNKCESRVKLE